LRTKTNQFYVNVVKCGYDVIVLTETWLTNNISNVELFGPEYEVFRFDRVFSRGGGVLIAISSSISCSSINLFNPVNCEAVWAEFSINLKKFIIGVHYIPPNSDLNTYQSHIEIIGSLIEKFDDTYQILVFGDFNLPDISWVPHSNYLLPIASLSVVGSNFVDAMASFDLKQINNIFNIRNRLLDLIFATGNFFELNFFIEECSDCLVKNDEHHKSILLDINVSVKEFLKPLESVCFDFKRGDYCSLNSFFNDIDWLSLFDFCDLDCAVSRFYDILFFGFSEFVPVRKSNFKNNTQWFDKDLKRAKNRLNRLYKLKRINPKYSEWYRLARQNFNKLKRNKFRSYISKIELGIKHDPKNFWNFVNKKRGVSGYPRSMVLGDAVSNSATLSASLFQTFFMSNFMQPTSSLSPVTPPYVDCENIGLIQFDCDEVFDYMKRLKLNYSPGPDGVPAFVLRKCAESLAIPLTFIFNRSLVTSYFPNCWKFSYVVPVFKTGDRSNIQNYRPISILSAVSKLFESMVKDIMFNSLKKLIIPEQHGFFPGRSTSTNLIEFVNFSINSFEERLQVDVVFTDFTKAFDRISHEILLSKLHSIGVHSCLLWWINSYLSDRRQVVKLGDIVSDSFHVPSGVPQGSHLGPLLFLVFINDVKSCLHDSHCLLYADDMKIFRKINSNDDCLLLQNDLNRFYDWCKVNNLELNINKCRVLHLNYKKSVINFSYIFNDSLLLSVDEFKDLGVILDNKLTFNLHLNYIINKSNSMLGFLFRTCKYFRNYDALKSIYFSLVRSHVEFSSIVWSPQYNVHSERIEKVQRKFTRVVYRKLFNTNQDLSYDERCRLLQVQPLHARRSISSACFMFDLLLGQIDSSNLLSKLNFTTNNLNIRNRKFIQPRFHRTNYGCHNPLDIAVNNFNTFYPVFDFNISKIEFKRRITKFLNL